MINLDGIGRVPCDFGAASLRVQRLRHEAPNPGCGGSSCRGCWAWLLSGREDEKRRRCRETCREGKLLSGRDALHEKIYANLGAQTAPGARSGTTGLLFSLLVPDLRASQT